VRCFTWNKALRVFHVKHSSNVALLREDHFVYHRDLPENKSQ